MLVGLVGWLQRGVCGVVVKRWNGGESKAVGDYRRMCRGARQLGVQGV
jgi:rubrerythrin